MKRMMMILGISAEKTEPEVKRLIIKNCVADKTSTDSNIFAVIVIGKGMINRAITYQPGRLKIKWNIGWILLCGLVGVDSTVVQHCRTHYLLAGTKRRL
ncbi:MULTISPECIES: hypothetical protein [Erwinia]|uniref:Uncharacterized protein n=1 Tax=Erwinia papayae TaxID=206499 RepID=A0ABV3N0F9_9GAMM|nr:hypothetical protein [Erwinia mallotivora]